MDDIWGTIFQLRITRSDVQQSTASRTAGQIPQRLKNYQIKEHRLDVYVSCYSINVTIFYDTIPLNFEFTSLQIVS